MTDLYDLSTYHIPVEVYDENDDPYDLTDASVQYKMHANGHDGEELFHLTDADLEIDLSAGQAHEFEITIDAVDMDVPENVFEEIRVTVGDRSAVVLQRRVAFRQAITSP